jgi:hypothetical protein
MGILELDRNSNQLYLKANIFIYGDAADQRLAEIIAEDIASHWNEPKATVIVDSISFTVRFIIRGFHTPGLTDVDVLGNTDPENNFFRIEEFAHGDISFVDGIGSNTGYFKLANLLNHSTTAAHEFGHTIGLDHPVNLDIRGSGVPGIMYPRGTITDPPFQYNPAAAPGTVGGTMNPAFRKVKQEDVDLLNLSSFDFRTPAAVIGEFSSIWHDRHFD